MLHGAFTKEKNHKKCAQLKCNTCSVSWGFSRAVYVSFSLILSTTFKFKKMNMASGIVFHGKYLVNIWWVNQTPVIERKRQCFQFLVKYNVLILGAARDMIVFPSLDWNWRLLAAWEMEAKEIESFVYKRLVKFHSRNWWIYIKFISCGWGFIFLFWQRIGLLLMYRFLML